MLFQQAPHQNIIKLQDSRLHGVDSGAELFLVEGDSARKRLAICAISNSSGAAHARQADERAQIDIAKNTGKPLV